MTHPLYELVLQQVDNAVYEVLFGMGKNDMLRAAYLRHPTGWGDNWGDDDDENMRDCLSAQALTVLERVESEGTSIFRNWATEPDAPFDVVLDRIRDIARKHKPDNFVIWGHEPEAE